MKFLNENIKSLYFKYLVATFGSAMITSIYSLVDMAMVGQYYGPVGTATLTIVAPIWNIIFSLGLLTGIGGAVLYSTTKGQNENKKSNENEYFTMAFIGSVILGGVAWLGILFYDDEILRFFGGTQELISMAKIYLYPMKFVFPLFLFNQMLSAFLRNDNNPTLATMGILLGGIFNIIGDYVFVFTFDMGILGAGVATALGALISFLVLTSHFFTKKNSLKLVQGKEYVKKLGEIVYTGFSTFFIDIAMGILTIIFNKQIMKYLNADALAVYGVIVNISTFVQCCAYSIGQAAQPIISINFGANQWGRIRETLKYSIYTVIFFSCIWVIFPVVVPNFFIRIFMKPSEEILRIAPLIIRCYSISFLFLPLNIFSTYYFQSLLQPKISFIISIMRGLILSGILLVIFPIVFPVNSIWLAMFITEGVVGSFAIYMIIKLTIKNRYF